MKQIHLIRIAASLAAGVLLAAAVSAGSFQKKNTYTPGMFADVSADAWYDASVADVYELGFMSGVGGGYFAPEDNVTVAEIITMTSRARAILDDDTIDTSAEGEWYAPYVAYAVRKGFVGETQYTAADFDRPATRAEVAVLLHDAVPKETFTAVNAVSAIPDVPQTAPYFDKVLTLYKAGILMGSDDIGTFYPDNSIIRAETAAMIARVALTEKRVKKTMATGLDALEAYALIQSDTLRGALETVNSGWQLDNRGALPKSAASSGGDMTLTDISEEQGTRLIRPFGPVENGVLVLETSIAIGGSSNDGVYLAFTAEDGKELYHIETAGGKWLMTTAGGTREAYAILEGEGLFTFNITLDLTNGTSKTFINCTDCGSDTLLTGSPAASLVLGTTEKSMAALTVRRAHLNANYAVNDDFTYDSDTPFDYTCEKAAVGNGGVNIEKGGYASKTFGAIGGRICAEVTFFGSDGAEFTLNNGADTLFRIFTVSGKLFAGGNDICDAPADMWHRLRLEADTASGTVTVRLNGRVRGTASFDKAGGTVDGITLACTGTETVSFDDVKVYNLVEHADYVPAPVAPKGGDKYTVGVNVCSLWRNGDHYGWAPISPYEKPLIGYYDEGNPESADWEIKYMVEHGIDFQSFCFFPEQTNAPLRKPSNSYALHDGFMNAKYSDQMHYALIWECANAKMPAGMEAWKKYYVPYIIENYFKDPRYMVIGNMPVFSVFGAGNLNGKDVFGSWQGTREAFDYFEAEVRKLGFDGILFLALGGSNDTLALMGFKGSYAYSWSRDGYKVDANVNGNLTSAGITSMYTVPTVSVGFNDIAWWGGVRYPLISIDDYKTVHQWVKDEYLPKYAEKGTWKENFVMLSTWNEYGEGTYIMPCENNGGFGYLDTIRAMYTDETENASVDIIPTEAQKARIGRLYPKDHALLKYEGYYNAAEDDKDAVSAFYTLAPNGSERVVKSSTMKTFEITDTAFKGETGDDSNIFFYDMMPFELGEITKLRVRFKGKVNDQIEIFFTTDKDGKWDAVKSFRFRSTSAEMTDYIVDVTGNPKWKGTLTALRFDPAYYKDTAFELEYIEFLPDAAKKHTTITVDGNDVELTYPSVSAENGDYLIPFETQSLPDVLNAFAVWDKASKTVRIEIGRHVHTFTVGKDTYTFDGAEKPLGYTLGATDGLPMIPLNRLCADAGFDFAESATDVNVSTARKWYFDIVGERDGSAYEFGIPGDTEKWTSSYMSLNVTDGYLHMSTITNGTDPTMVSGTNLQVYAERYDTLEIKCRYSYDHKEDDVCRIAMFFLTDKDTTWNEDKCIKGWHETVDTKGEWITYTFDLNEYPAWKDVITRLRFDPFDAHGEMDIDYIRFIEKEGYVWIDPKDRPFTIRNGNADDENDVAFKSINGKVEIDNGAYLVTPNPGKQWLYIGQEGTFKPGKLYHVAYDVKLAGKDRNKTLSPSELVYINCNIQYDDPTSKTDHVVLSKGLCMNDEWVHCECDVVINAASENRGKDQFSVYSNPVGDTSISYFLDNVVVTEVND